MSRIPAEDVEVVEFDEPERDGMIDLEELSEKAKEKAMWGVFWSAIFFIVVIFLALWLFNVYRRWRAQRALGQSQNALQSFVGQAIQEVKPNMVFPNGGSMSAPAVSGMDGNIQHQLMMNPNNPMIPMMGMAQPLVVDGSNNNNIMPNNMIPSSPNSPVMSDGDGMNAGSNPYDSHRCFLWFKDTNRESKKLYRQFCKLRNYYTKNSKFLKSGHAPITFHKFDLRKGQCKAFFDQLAMNGNAAQDVMHDGQAPLVTFGLKNQPQENVVGGNGVNSSAMSKKIDNLLNTTNTNSM